MADDRSRRSDDGSIAPIPEEFRTFRPQSRTMTRRWVWMTIVFLVPMLGLTYVFWDNATQYTMTIMDLREQNAALRVDITNKENKIIQIEKIINENAKLRSQILDLSNNIYDMQENIKTLQDRVNEKDRIISTFDFLRIENKKLKEDISEKDSIIDKLREELIEIRGQRK